mgnify:CR=1
AALANTSNYAGAITISNNDYTTDELKAINNGTAGAITLTHTAVALSDTSSDLAAALAGTITAHTGTIAI